MNRAKPIGGVLFRIDGFETDTITADQLSCTGNREGVLGQSWIYFRVELEKDHWGQACWIEWSVELDEGCVRQVETLTGGSATIVQNHLFFEPIQSS